MKNLIVAFFVLLSFCTFAQTVNTNIKITTDKNDKHTFELIDYKITFDGSTLSFDSQIKSNDFKLKVKNISSVEKSEDFILESYGTKSGETFVLIYESKILVAVGIVKDDERVFYGYKDIEKENKKEPQSKTHKI